MIVLHSDCEFCAIATLYGVSLEKNIKISGDLIASLGPKGCKSGFVTYCYTILCSKQCDALLTNVFMVYIFTPD